MPFARINDITIHYQTIGASADKPIMVFSNSLGTDLRIWRDVVERLAGDVSLVLYDKRGHGLSDIGPRPCAIEDHASDLARLLDMLYIKDAFICGVSAGGLVAQSLYQRRPDLVRALILCDTAHKIGTAEGWNDRIARIEAEGLESIAEGILERWFAPAFRRRENAAFEGYRNMLIRQPSTGYLATCEAVRDADYTEAARQIRVPTICIVGDEDGSTPPALVLSLAKLIPNAHYEVIRNAGHIPCVEQPEALTEVIKTFLSSVAHGEKNDE